MTATNVVGICYLLHFSRRYHHTAHYLGWTQDLEARLALPASGQGARLMRVIKDEGSEWELARVWEGDRHRERQLKQRGKTRCCPLCQGTGTAIKWQQLERVG